MKKIWIIVGASLLFMACGGGGAGTGTSSQPALVVKIGGQDVPFEVKSSWQMTKNYTSYGEPGNPTTALHWFTIRNHAYDKPNSTILFDDEKLKAPGQVLVFFALYGDKGTTNGKSPLKAADYKGDGKYSTSLGTVTVYQFAEGRDEIAALHIGPGSPDNKGEVKITSVTGDTVTGEIDATGKVNGKDVSVKGPFTAKIFQPPQ